jgi:hypothetical protein
MNESFPRKCHERVGCILAQPELALLFLVLNKTWSAAVFCEQNVVSWIRSFERKLQARHFAQDAPALGPALVAQETKSPEGKFSDLLPSLSPATMVSSMHTLVFGSFSQSSLAGADSDTGPLEGRTSQPCPASAMLVKSIPAIKLLEDLPAFEALAPPISPPKLDLSAFKTSTPMRQEQPSVTAMLKATSPRADCKTGRFSLMEDTSHVYQPIRELASRSALPLTSSHPGNTSSPFEATREFHEPVSRHAFLTPSHEPALACAETPMSQLQLQASQALRAAYQSQTLFEHATQAGQSMELPTQSPDTSLGASQVAAEILHASQQVWTEHRVGPAALGAWEMDAVRAAFEQSAQRKQASALLQSASVAAAAAAAIEMQYGQESAEIMDALAETAVRGENADALPSMDAIEHQLCCSGLGEKHGGEMAEGPENPFSGRHDDLGNCSDGLQSIAEELEQVVSTNGNLEEGSLCPRVRGAGSSHEVYKGTDDEDMVSACKQRNEDSRSNALEQLEVERQAVRSSWPPVLGTSRAPPYEAPVLRLSPSQGDAMLSFLWSWTMCDSDCC